ncbi:MAG: HEAT repeat domain-containing protein [Polyangiaceae bacterium]|nr:HEAT repeat domain-containing protein [Polyangiaceae bacterium]
MRHAWPIHSRLLNIFAALFVDPTARRNSTKGSLLAGYFRILRDRLRDILCGRMTFFPFRRVRDVLPVVLIGSAACAALLATDTAHATPMVAELASRLRTASDSRVRVQAALALGATKSNDAIAPLCDGLDDTSPTVRSAAAAGLGKLRKNSGLKCLEQRAKAEKNASVMSQIERSINQVKEGAGSASTLARAPTSSTKWYVAVGKTKNNGDRNNSEMDALVQEALRKALLATPAFAVAPPDETASQAQRVVQQNKVSGYFLQPTVEAPKYEDSKLTVLVRVTMFTYPNKALQGEFAPKLTQSGTPSKDIASENELIKMAVERAVARFVTVCETTKN